MYRVIKITSRTPGVFYCFYGASKFIQFFFFSMMPLVITMTTDHPLRKFLCIDVLSFSDVLNSCPQKEPLQVSSSLQDGRQSVRLHCHRVRHEGVWLVAREGLQLCQAKEEHHSTEPRFHETAGRVRGHPGCQVKPCVCVCVCVCVHSVVL